MEISTLTIVTTFFLVLLVTGFWLWRSHRKLPPGPRGFPVLGCLPFLGREFHRYLAELAETYGPIFCLRIGTRLQVVVSSPALAKEIFKTKDPIFANHPPSASNSVLNDGESVVFAPNGPHWRLLRKVVVRELLSSPMIDSLEWVRRRVMNRALAEINDGIGRPVSIRNAVCAVAHKMIFSMMWEGRIDEKGSDHGAISDADKKEVQDVVNGMIAGFMTPNISDLFPVLAPLDIQGLRRRMKRLGDRFDAVFSNIVRKRAAAASKETPGGEAAKSKDFVQLLLDLVDRKDPEMLPFQLKHAKALLLDLMGAGMDTAATTIEWTMAELLRLPEVMAKVREELSTVVGRGNVLEEAQVPRLVYLNAVMRESLRLHPPGPLLIPHVPSEDCEVGGYVVPRGANVFVNVWAIQRDPSVWEQPLEFRPERFLERRERMGDDFEFMPFGKGRRICPGMELGEKMVVYILGSLLHSFRWEVPDGANVGIDDEFGVALRKKDPLVLVPFLHLHQ